MTRAPDTVTGKTWGLERHMRYHTGNNASADVGLRLEAVETTTVHRHTGPGQGPRGAEHTRGVSLFCGILNTRDDTALGRRVSHLELRNALQS